jgi:hypothetical protein
VSVPEKGRGREREREFVMCESLQLFSDIDYFSKTSLNGFEKQI